MPELEGFQVVTVVCRGNGGGEWWLMAVDEKTGQWLVVHCLLISRALMVSVDS